MKREYPRDHKREDIYDEVNTAGFNGEADKEEQM